MTAASADDQAPQDLPPLSDERLAAIESAVFGRIADERGRHRPRRSRWWLGGAAAAAVVVVAAIIAPGVMSSLSVGGSAGSLSESAPDQPAVGTDSGMRGAAEPLTGSGDQAAPGTAEGSVTNAANGSREIVTTANATLIVADAAEAARDITADAEARGGYVESLNIDALAGETSERTDAGSDTSMATDPSTPGAGWITVRLPSDALDDAIDALGSVGEVTSSSIGRQDVTDQTIDLRARVAASEASVERLTQLIGQAESVADLIAAESALSERQAALESDRQQLEGLEDEVALSTLSVQLSPRTMTVQADPAGFGDGLAAGWNGLIATLNGVVVALGFLLPWLVIVGAVTLIVRGVLRLVRGARTRRDVPETADDSSV
ncbi:DUF4349 domain-containing protein [Microbacterium sp. P05]|uniref:DUF4349 domain-containing protein n=1 Tax=Microbacterium sp. P05 TaxID=3366948 RepID=UPI0037466640